MRVAYRESDTGDVRGGADPEQMHNAGGADGVASTGSFGEERSVEESWASAPWQPSTERGGASPGGRPTGARH
jgi:hypothetical protein